MIFLEAQARSLLVLHALVGGLLVGLATHQALSAWRYARGLTDRARQERRYLRLTALVYLAALGLGLLQYPAYRVRVRAEYLDAPASVEAELALRRQAATTNGTPAPAGVRTAPTLGWVGRLFDIKEHWAALGLLAVLALVALGGRAHPAATQPAAAGATVLYVGLSLVVCGAAWLATVVGVVTASYRAVGGAS